MTAPGEAPPAAPAFLAHRQEFADVTGRAPRLVRLVEADAHEGPVHCAHEDALYVTTTRRGAHTSILRIALDGLAPVGPDAVSVLRADANTANGMALAPDGRLVVCEQGGRGPARIALVDRVTGAAEPLVGSFRGQPLNSPNDVVVACDGAVWFTDPAYGALQGFRPAPALGEHVYRHDPATGDLDVVATGFDKPNGLVFAPDGDVLYVGDSGADRGTGAYEPHRPHHVLAFGVVEGRLGTSRLVGVTVPGAPDGLAVDRAGRLYIASAGGIAVRSPSGDLLGEIVLPGAVNLTFGRGPDGPALYVTTDTAVWAAVLATTGVDQ